MKKDIVKPSILPGFMELLPADQIVFNKMKDTIRHNYEKFGFIPLDTPTIEKSEILLAKGGGETEKQIYRFNKGNTDLSLRFDLTVPLARYVSQHFSDLNFPFRRYHISKVFRGERNQKGRFREFYQCDIDIIGNGSLSIINDAEIPSIIYQTFKELGFEDFTIRINNRKVLNGFFEGTDVEDRKGVLRAIDKIEKIGEDGVRKELQELGLEDSKIDKIINFINIKGTKSEVIKSLKELDIENDVFKEGVYELEKVVHYIKSFNVPDKNYKIDLTIARGLDYYTGTVYETVLNNYPQIGSVCSGGRYDNLAEHYTNQKLPGVGISIGLTRLFYQLREAKIIGENASSTLSQALVIPVGDTMEYSIKVANKLRENEIISELYLEDAKIGKKFAYADKLKIPYVILIGEDELKEEKVSVKNMETGNQESMSLEEAIKIIKNA
ncbi:histidine--tRNA ligase [Clostridium tetani]|uniref:Histidine--tRNA ligase n=1 Tax=Clostridium tetani (strain Massachusetts / E88) TaxID=212717 RepID=SYH_CLOTE|nr:histidine--tRNA ligase [Clostridium tetani]Q892X7.1 RecName: Full=Histidine--tRNA ligase; AltName: Full=Histidyl-tRNA synthetase; Short=HisRS [Clostridium tetani E88]AAO36465.1 histidyl-tRNA synthetase [Clostridium tetani E88]KGI37573.1 histidyl-tRNA synthase [Clostridium tetani]KGI39485.1 histidyl-tRNA synthase [Clostridium tetani ATCC 9441]KGI45706.1 histidyl-tRNA synthase [Clostridium tetani]KHO31588.1 histidyl-tRNA synthase [Clostridium tetani]